MQKRSRFVFDKITGTSVKLTDLVVDILEANRRASLLATENKLLVVSESQSQKWDDILVGEKSRFVL